MIQLLDIVGQGAAVSRLQRAMAAARMPHAFIFAGPRGVGRRTTAAALAAALLCEKPRRRKKKPGELPDVPDDAMLLDACGHCEDCRMMAAGSHPDFQLVYKELAAYHEDAGVRGRVMQELGIEVIRSFLIAPAYRAATRGRGKVFVVLESELMSTPAQNSLLKTLEEPPPGVTIVLICERAEELLPTTLSRSALVRFGPLPRDFVQARLLAEGVGAAEAQFWAQFTEGSLGQASRLAKKGMYAVKVELIDRLGALPPTGDAELGDFLVKTSDALGEIAIKEAKEEGGAELSKALAGRQAVAMMLGFMASAYRDALHVKCGRNDDLRHGDQAAAIAAIAGRFSHEQLAEIIEQFSEYETLLWRNVNAKIVWDNVAITCACAAPLRF